MINYNHKEGTGVPENKMRKEIIIMKLLKILASAAVSAAVLTAFAAGAAAYDLNKDLKTGWSASVTIPGEEFEGATTDSVFTITFTADASLAEKEGDNYWCIKPMINDTGWPFLDTLVGPALSDGKDSYPVAPEDTELKFTIPAEELEHLQVAGMAIMGHGVTLGTITFSNDETLAAPVEEAAVTVTAAPAETAEGGNPATGADDLAGMAAALLVSGGAMALTAKKRS